MPQVIAAVAPIATNLLVGIGASLISSWLSPKQQAATRTETAAWKGIQFQVSVGEDVPVSAIVGRGRTAGHLLFAQEYGANNEYLKLVFACGKGRYDGFETALIEEKPITLSGSNDDEHGRVVEQYRIDAAGTVGAGEPHLWIKAYDGRPGQAADPGLIAAAGGSGRWGTMHKATGTPYIIVTLRYHADLFPKAGLPQFGFVWRGLRLYDWRKDSTVPGGAGAQRWADPSTWTWTENPPVIAWNFRRGVFVNGVKVLGFGFSEWSNDRAYFTAAANIADELVTFAATGATMARYTFGREISDAEDRLAVLRELEQSWCGSSFDRGGAYAPLPAAQEIPVITLDFADRLPGASRRDLHGLVSAKRTAWHGTFTSIADNWVPTPFEQRINVDLETLLRGRKAVKFDQPYEHNQERAQMRAEIELRRQLFPATVTATWGPEAKLLEAGDPVTFESDWGPKLMKVASIAPTEDDNGRTITLTEWSNTIVPASGEDFITLPSGPGVGPSDPDRTIFVAGFGLAAYARAGGGAVHPFAKATWSHITDPNVDQIMIRVWPATGDEATDGETFFANPKLQDTKLVGPLRAETAYLGYAIPIRRDGRITIKTATVAFVTGAESAPVAPDSVRPEHLAAQLRNERGWLFGPDDGETLASHLARLEAQLAEQAAAGLLDRAERKEQVRIMKALQGAATAAIVETRKAIAEQSTAFAEFRLDVLAQLNTIMAGGLIKIEAVVDEDSATAQIVFRVRAKATDAWPAEATLVLGAKSEAGGTVDSWLGLMADRLFMLSTLGEIVDQPFAIEGGQTTILDLLVRRLRSLDLVSIDINGSDDVGVLIGGGP